MIRRVAVLILVLLWAVPVLGLAVTALRERDQILASGWWRAAAPVAQIRVERLPPGAGTVAGGITAWGISARAPAAYAPGATARLNGGADLTLEEGGAYRLTGAAAVRIHVTRTDPPRITLANFTRVLQAEGVGQAFLTTLAVAIPGTVLPVGIAVSAAYALAWMRFPGRAMAGVVMVGLMAVPLQMALIPVLRMHAGLGLGRGWIGIWLVHTGFGLPIAIHLLRGMMARLPPETIAAARLDGASEARILRRIVLPACAPGIAAFALFQFIWVWNDLLVGSVFLGGGEVLTERLQALSGSRGGDWDLLAASAVLSVLLPVGLYLLLDRGRGALQRA